MQERYPHFILISLVLKWLCRSPCCFLLFLRAGPDPKRAILWWQSVPQSWKCSKGRKRKSRCSHSEPDIEKWQVNHGLKNKDWHFLRGFCVSDTALSNLHVLFLFQFSPPSSSEYWSKCKFRGQTGSSLNLFAVVWPWALISVYFSLCINEIATL